MDQNNTDALSLIVAIGGSAGALKSFELIVESLPVDASIAYVVIQHMGPDQKSALPELLKRKTQLKVLPARNGLVLSPNTIYVSRPGCSLELQGHVIHSHPIENLSERRNPIDHFFESLSHNYGNRAVGIVVSGTGSDGTLGLKTIKEASGFSLVQDPLEAKFDGMPKSAIAECSIDYIVPAANIGDILTSLVQRMKKIKTVITKVVKSEDELLMNKICAQLHAKTGHDFSSYKKTTVSRRIEKRIQAKHLNGLQKYSDILETEEQEASALLKDLLISVTSFFRDPDAFAYLKNNVIPKIFDDCPADSPIRIWVPACATGEEPYSLAMLLKEHMLEQDVQKSIQIFATDIDRPALETARNGRYTVEAVKTIPQEFLKKYFTKNIDSFQVSQALREMCIFSEHNVIKDPPFSKLNFISCRNLFIYMESELQGKIFPLFHFSLLENGFLFLGPADNVTGMGHSFKTIDKKNKIFQKTNKLSKKTYSSYMKNSNNPPLPTITLNQKIAVHGEKNITKVISSNLLEHFAPPAVVITEKGDIAFYSGQTGKFFETPTGAPTINIYDLIIKSVRPALHALMFRAIKEKAEVNQSSIPYEVGGTRFVMNLSVKPMVDLPDLYLVVFKDIDVNQIELDALSLNSIPNNDFFIQQLEKELKETKEHLQSTIEQVKSSNEELLSINEELQSANEELQTSKEELQSTNEELETVNAEVTSKVEELDQANSDLQNYFANTQVPILFLDPELKVQKYTPATAKIFKLIPSDTGRHITDVATILEDQDLMSAMNSVLENLQAIEKQVQTKDKTSQFIVKITPYRPSLNTIGGLVVTLSDVTELKKIQEKLSDAYTNIVDIIENMGDAFFAVDANWKITKVNEKHCEIVKVTRANNIGADLWNLFPRLDNKDSKYYIYYNKVMKDRVSVNFEDYYEPLKLWTEVNVLPTSDGGLAVFYRDTTEKNNYLNSIHTEKHKFEAIFEDSASSMALLCGPEFVFEKANPEYLALMGNRDILNKPLLEALPELRGQPFYDLMNEVFTTGKPFIAKDMVAKLVRTKGKDPEDVYFDFTYSRILDGAGNPYGIYIHAINVTEKYYAKQAILETQSKLNVALASAHMGTWDLDPATGQVRWSERTNELFGVERTDELPLESALKQIHPADTDRVRKAIEKAIDPKGNGEYKIEYRIKRKDGSFRWVSLLGQSYFADTENGRIATNFSGVVFDVSDQKISEEKLVQAVRSRDEFLSIASHELKTPLTSLKFQAQMRKRNALRGKEADFSVEKTLQMAVSDEKQIDRITRLIDDMLDITRINAGKLSIVPERVNICDLVSEVVDRFSEQANLAGCEIQISACKEIYGQFDRFRIEQVFTNLLTNALKYGAGTPVHISADNDNEFILLKVRDFGIGIADVDQSRVFGQFERAINANEISGLGLGLYIVREIVTAHKGMIWVESEVDKGSTFIVKLPKEFN